MAFFFFLLRSSFQWVSNGGVAYFAKMVAISDWNLNGLVIYG